MKFVCRKCESFMAYQDVEPISEGSLGITFKCSGCGNRISMVTNPGETQMVHSLGVQLGGRKDERAPLELTRQSLASPSVPTSSKGRNGVTSKPDLASITKESLGKCPFAKVVTEMVEKAKGKEAEGADRPIRWSAEAEERIRKVPEVVQGFARSMIEGMAREAGVDVVDGALMDEAKKRFM